MARIRNFGGNLTFRPRRVAAPRDTAELAAIVQSGARVRPVGSAHSWSPAFVTDETLLSLRKLNRLVELDRARGQVTVEAGMRLRELNRLLDARGLALANLGSIDAQTVAGVIATGTHGTGANFRCLAAQVARLALVDGRGRQVVLERGQADFDGAVVGLGALGVVHQVTFDVVPAFRLHDVTAAMPFDEVIERVHELRLGSDHFKVWWAVPCQDAIAFSFRRTDEPALGGALRAAVREHVLSVAAYRALLVIGHASGRRAIPAINRLLTRQVGKPLTRTVASHRGFLTPAPPVHRESEWAFDVRDAQPLLRAYRRWFLESGYRFNFIQELRFSAADELWLSPAYRRDTIWLSLYNIDRRAWPEQLASFEAFARAHGGRPHWGKEASFERTYLEQHVPRLADFRALCERYDPDGKLRNPWLDSFLAPAPA